MWLLEISLQIIPLESSGMQKSNYVVIDMTKRECHLDSAVFWQERNLVLEAM